MDEELVNQSLHLKAVDFSRPTLRVIFLLALVSLILSLLLFRPYSMGGTVARQFLSTDIADLALKQLQGFELEVEDQLVTVMSVQDERLGLFVRAQLGRREGTKQLSNIPVTFWEVALRAPGDYTTALEWKWKHGNSARIRDGREIHRALIRLDEQGRWFQFYRQGSLASTPLRAEDALTLATNWARTHPLIIPEQKETFQPTATPQINFDGKVYQFSWNLAESIPGLGRQVVIEVVGDTVSYYGLEYTLPTNYPTNRLWEISLLLRLLLLGSTILAVIIFLIKYLRRDAIDFDFSFTYSALLTFPFIAIVVADLPSLMNDGFIPVVKENFYLLSTLTFFWFILILLTTPVVALTDSLVRQVWPEKLSTFDALIRGRFQSPNVGRAMVIGLSVGVTGFALKLVANALLVSWGDYSHTSMFTSLSSSIAAVWAVFGALGLALICSYLLLFIAVLVRQRVQSLYTIAILTGLIWFILLATTGGRYSSLLNFACFALINVLISLYLLLRYDLLTLVAAWFAGVASLAAMQLLSWSNPVYMVNGAAVLVILGGVFYYSIRLVSSLERLPDPSFVPQYITRLHSRERIERDIEIARELQYQFLPQHLPDLTSLSLATLCRPAYEVGGDYYDFIELGPHKMGLVIADVSGKGIPAAFYMTMIKGIIQSRALEVVSPRDLLKQINWVIYKNTGTNTFVTLFYGIVDTLQATLVYSNAGHNPPLIISADGQVMELSCGGVVLGVLPHPEYQEEIVELKDKDLFVFYTDGVVETTDVMGVEFGTQRLAAVIKNSHSRNVSNLITEVGKALDAFAAGEPQTDDITLIVASFNQDEKTNNRH